MSLRPSVTCVLGALLLVLASAGPAAAQAVVPSERVTSRVIVRAEATTRSADVGSLRPGERAALVEAGDTWHRVELAGGRRGFVSAAWTVLVPEAWGPDVAARPPAGAPAEHAGRFDFAPEATLAASRTTPAEPEPSGIGGLFRRIARLFRPPERVTVNLTSPKLGATVREHYDPRLPVAGLAHTSGSRGRFDVMLVIDVSGSTSEFAHADVDGDGEATDDWKSADSILRAQARAAASFFVDRVKLVNRTTGQESDYVATGIDGSFYGEVPLAEGENQIELVAVLYGGKQHVERLAVDFRPVPREQRLAEELDAIRDENAALIETLEERLREKLARELAAAREAARAPDQDKQLEVRIDRP